MFEKLKKFLKEVRLELTKVTWPTVNELRGSTAVVIVTVLVFTVFIYLVDKGLVLIIHQALR
jgi:preprotein translocase subunit SecE